MNDRIEILITEIEDIISAAEYKCPQMILKWLRRKIAYVLKSRYNKKVFLRERKRHTARRVAGVRCAALSNSEAYPIQS